MKPNPKRKRSDSSDSTPKLDLEVIIGLTTKNSNGLASNISSDACIYLAGCVVVIYNIDSATHSHLMVSVRTPQPLSCVAISQDGRYIASGESGNQPAVLIWDYSTQALISELKGHQYGVASIAFSPNGKHMVSAGFPRDGYLCLWDWQSGALVAKLKSSSSCSTIASVCFSSDANFFVTAGKKHLKFWKVGSTRRQSNVRASLLPLDGKLANLGCLRGSSFVSVASPTRTANNLDGSDWAGKFYPIYALTDAGVLCVLHSGFSISKWVDLKVKKSFALTVSNKLIACACNNGVVQLLTVDTLKYAGNLQYADVKECHEATGIGFHTKYSEKGFRHASTLPDAIACQFSASEKLVVVFGDHSLYVWEIHDEDKVRKCSVFSSHSACIWDVQNLPCENRHDSVVACATRGCSGRVSFATCSADGTIRFWRFTSQPNSVKKDQDADLFVDQQIDGNSLNAGSAHAIRLESSGRIFECGVGTQGFRSMAVSSDGTYLVAGDFLGNLHIYNLLDSDYKCFQEAHNAEILSLSFSLPVKNTVISEQEASESLYLLASGGRDGIIHLYDVNRGFDPIEGLDDHSAAVTSVKFTCDGRKILSCSVDRSIVIGDVSLTNTGCKISRRHRQIASQGTIYDMAIDSAMEVAVTVGQDKKINTFNITTGKLVRTFKQHGDFGDPIKVNIDPSSSYLVCSYSNKSICIYDFTSGELVAKAVGHGEVITDVIFLPDCKHIISVGGDGCIFLWKMPALLSSKIFLRIKEHTDTKSAISMDNPFASNESLLCDSKHMRVLEKSAQNVQKVLFQEGDIDEVSAFKFSISKLPKWAQAIITKETVPADREPALTQCQQLDLGSCSSIVDNGGTSVSKRPKVERPCRRDLGGTEICFTDLSKTSFDIHPSQSSPMFNEIPRFTIGNRWLTIHNVCFEPLDSPEDKDLKNAMLPAPVPISSYYLNPKYQYSRNLGLDDDLIRAVHTVVEKLEPDADIQSRCIDEMKSFRDGNGSFGRLSATRGRDGANPVQDPAMERVQNSDRMDIALGAPVVRTKLLEEPQSCSEAVARDILLHSCKDEIMANATVKEKADFMYGGNDLFSRHFGNLSTSIKDVKTGTGSYLPQITDAQDIITGCSQALLSLNAAAQCALGLFSTLETLLSRQDAITRPRTEFYNQSAELLPTIKEKVNALADLVQSGSRNPCS